MPSIPPSNEIRLTQYSHGAGCGCKISPAILETILQTTTPSLVYENLLVGNQSRDDAAVLDLGNGQVLISTTDFFMPIVDDPFDFGRIASANAISDVYAMGGTPVLAIAILGWPVNILAPELARQVLEGSRSICMEAGIPLAGGHSIDSPEPIFGLAVNGLAPTGHIKRNNGAREGDVLLLTKPIGVGILTTAEKKGKLRSEDAGIAARQMMQLNTCGRMLGTLKGVTAMTDVTGFGLLGHLIEMVESSGLGAILYFKQVPLILAELADYIKQDCIPGGSYRNWESYGQKVRLPTGGDEMTTRALLADPQTSGGLLIAVQKESLHAVQEILRDFGLDKYVEPIGVITSRKKTLIEVL